MRASHLNEGRDQPPVRRLTKEGGTVRVLTILGAWCGLAGVALAVGCARVDVRKVPARSDYREWDDGKQAAADSIKGIRYYMPRPYLSVSTPFVVAGGDFLVSGEVGQDGALVQIDAKSLPPHLAKQFSVVGGSALVPAADLRASPDVVRRLRVAGGGGGSGAGGAEQAATGPSTGAGAPSTVQVTARAMSEVTVSFSPQVVFPSDEAIEFVVKLDKAAPFDTAKDARPVVVPLDAALNPLPDKAVAVPITSSVEFKAGATGAEIKSTIRPSDLKGARLWLGGMLFDAKMLPADTEARRYLAYAVKPRLNIEAAGPAGAPQADGAGAAKPEKTTEASNDPATATEFSASGKGTRPIAVNPTFDILMLPDFDQQFAVDVDAGLGQAKSKVALGQGWMLENAETATDNRELGKFVFKQIEKFTDIAAAFLRAEAGLPALGDAGAAGLAAKSAEHGAGGRSGQQVVLRVRYVLEARPGVYPILKPGELNAWRRLEGQAPCDCAGKRITDVPTCACPTEDFVYIPCPPFTVVAHNVYRHVLVELVSTRGGDAAKTGGDPLLAAVKAMLPDQTLAGAVQGARWTAPGRLTLVVTKGTSEQTRDGIRAAVLNQTLSAVQVTEVVIEESNAV